MPAKEYSYTIFFQRISKGGYIVTAPVFPGLVAEADNIEEAREAVRAAIRAYIDELVKRGQPIPQEEKTVQEKISVIVML